MKVELESGLLVGFICDWGGKRKEQGQDWEVSGPGLDANSVPENPF